MSRLLCLVGAAALTGGLTACSALEGFLGAPLSVFDEETGEEVETTVGDAIADNAETAEGVVSGLLSGVNPLVGVAGGAAAAALFGAARRKKKATVEAEESEA